MNAPSIITPSCRVNDSPFKIDGPARISFSGGRTSAYMLWRILEAHGGTLPPDVVVAFANTGKEREETLRFVHECGTRWNVNIHWLEWRNDKAKPFEEVGFNSAARNGEPFQALIDSKQRLPNWKERWCTQYLKVIPLMAFAEMQGWATHEYAEVIGLRYDEGLRIIKGYAKAEERGRRVLYPLSKAKIVKADVMAFWAAQDFDLGLEPYEGNCDLCFLKGRGIRKRIIRDNPQLAGWWSENEIKRDGWFDKRDRVAGLVAEAYKSPELFEPEEYDVECGLTCGDAA